MTGQGLCGLNFVDLPQSASRRPAMVISIITRRNKEHSMMDVLMVALTIGWFALAIGYVYACERL
jgi:hypothetical protein